MSHESDEPEELEAPGERLTADEIDAEIRALAASPANWRRLQGIAAVLSSGIAGLTRDDLLQETLTRFLEGRRRWPRDTHPVVVMKNAMHSIASDARKRNDLSPVDESVALATGGAGDDATDTRPQAHGAATVTPEDEFSGKEQLVAVYAAVAGNEELELLVMAWADGLRGNDAAQELGWDKKKYEAARKRLVRRLEALDPIGDRK
jgi:DNA-directed RNA polymerase specialized sigma24 family protein